ncbi:MAG: hypothetical protein KGZ37_10935 [Nitrosarchaeum sp.]|nr:hypothetical protein [Nitrosarchaeum sp.]
MPHIVFDKKIDLFHLSKNFIPIFQKTPILIKIQSIYVEQNGYSALLPTIVIDKSHQEFLIEISTTEVKSTIRLYPGTDPEKTDGVKTSMALISKFLIKIFPDVKIIRSNIYEFIEKVN